MPELASCSAWSGKEHRINVSKSQKLSQASNDQRNAFASGSSSTKSAGEHTGVLSEAGAKAWEETPFLTEEKALTARLVEAGRQASLPSALTGREGLARDEGRP